MRFGDDGNMGNRGLEILAGSTRSVDYAIKKNDARDVWK